MGFYSQKDKAWATKKLGTCTLTIGGYGCFITSSVNLAKKLGEKKRTPLEINDWLVKNKGYAQGCALIPAKAGEYLKLKYLGSFKKPSTRYCVAETDNFKRQGIPQHFVLLDTKKNVRIDPLDLNPSWEKNTYRIVSYRIFEVLKKKEEKKKGDKKKDSTPKQDEVVKVPVTVVPKSPIKPEMPPVSVPKVETIPEVIPVQKPPQNSIFNQIINWLFSAKK